MAKVFLRVNGIDIPKAFVRRSLEGGAPRGKATVVVEVPATKNLESLGEIALDDLKEPGLPEFKIEVRENEGDWRAISAADLAGLLLPGKSNG